MKTIEDLTSLMPPPEAPVETGSPKGWAKAERRVGLALPRDYTAFIDLYGTGRVCGFIAVLNPFARNADLNLLELMPTLLSGLRELKREFPGFYPHPLHFEPGGFVPWGLSNQGDLYGWLTDGNQEDWKTVVFPGENPEQEVFELSFAGFLHGLVGGEVKSVTLPSDLLEKGAVFQPADGG